MADLSRGVSRATRRRLGRKDGACGGCGQPSDRPGYYYCRACHAAEMRDFRAQQKAKHDAMEAELAALREQLRHTA